VTTIGIRHADAGTVTERVSVVQKTLLAFGAISSVLYAFTDLLAGLNYQGYSFYSQTISELGAVGAPKPGWLAPLFITYCALMVAFSIAVVLYGIRNNDRIKKVGMLLLLYMVVGSGTTLYPMHVRGTATLADDMPHILAGLGATVVILVTMLAGSTALGKRFRIFSRVTFASILVFGALTVPSSMRLASGDPTPGMGLLERLAYYSILIWVAGLSIALVRSSSITIRQMLDQR
jgi:hypothetical membrane protein